MSKLYSRQYKEINVDYLLQIMIKSRLFIVIMTLIITLFSVFLAYSIKPVYEANALLKIGEYHKFQRNGDISTKPLDDANGLAKELSFLFINQSNSNKSVVKITAQKNLDNYIEITSEGLTPEGASSKIYNLLSFVQKKHSQILSNIRKQHKIELQNVVKKISTITKKQKEILSNQAIYNPQDYPSLSNTIQLMYLINNELGIGYIGQILERKEKLALLLDGGHENNTSLVGEVQVSPQPIKPKKKIIIVFGFFVGLLLSLSFVFIRELLVKK